MSNEKYPDVTPETAKELLKGNDKELDKKQVAIYAAQMKEGLFKDLNEEKAVNND